MIQQNMRKIALGTTFVLTAMVASAQNITLKGTVCDSNGEPVIGASIIEKSKPNNGTVSDLDGKFTLQVAKGATLTISYIVRCV